MIFSEFLSRRGETKIDTSILVSPQDSKKAQKAPKDLETRFSWIGS